MAEQVSHREPPVIDPTANVILLISAETKRQDDLRSSEAKRADGKFMDLEKSVDNQFEALRGSIEIVRQELDKRLKAIEDVRAQVQEQTAMMATKENVEFMVKSLDARVTKFENAQANNLGQMKGSTTATGTAVSIGALIAALIAILVTMFLK